jgi:hypothetical protein
MEPEWTKKIPNWFICDWFFLFFSLNAVAFALLLLSTIYLVFVSRGVPATLKPYMLFYGLMSIMVSGTSTLFYYLICDRSLKPTK